jgi:hypothetical protein
MGEEEQDLNTIIQQNNKLRPLVILTFHRHYFALGEHYNSVTSRIS